MYKTILTVRGNELDSYNHVNNAVYLNYFEQGRWEAFREAGLIEVIRSSSLLLVVTDIRIRYIRESILFDELEILTRIAKSSPFLVFHQRIHHHRTGLAVARAETKTVFLDEAREPRDIPDIVEQTLNL
jgi:YbgC/YbaW family acyl-CoA thioester hydrolase